MLRNLGARKSTEKIERDTRSAPPMWYLNFNSCCWISMGRKKERKERREGDDCDCDCDCDCDGFVSEGV